MRTKLLLLALFALVLCSPAIAADYYVDITNSTGHTIVYMHVSPGNAKTWEEDVLGANVLAAGGTQRVTLRGYSSPIFDVRLIDEDGDTYTWWSLDVSKHDIVVTLEDLD